MPLRMNMAKRSKAIKKVGFTLRSSLSWIRPTAAAVIAYAVLGWVELWQWGGIFLATYLMEIVAVYLAVPGSDDDDERDYYDDDGGHRGQWQEEEKASKAEEKVLIYVSLSEIITVCFRVLFTLKPPSTSISSTISRTR